MRDTMAIKALPVGVKGRATIDLFDKRGKLVEHIKKNNYVHPKALEYIGKVSAYNQFGLSWNNHTGSHTMMRGLMLTDNSRPADATKDFHIAGNLIGVGAINNTSADSKLRGAFNSGESILRADYKKLVYDFPTNAGNGTFQSIYTLPHDYNSSISEEQLGYMMGGYIGAPLSIPLTHHFSSSNTCSYIKFLERRLFFWYQTTLHVYNFNIPSIKIGLPTKEYEELLDKQVYTLSFNIDSLTVANGYIYYKSGTEIYRAPIDTPASAVEIANISIPSGHSFNSSAIMYNENTGKFYFSTYQYNNGWYYYLLEYDSNFNFLTTLDNAIGAVSRNSDFIRGTVDNILTATSYMQYDFDRKTYNHQLLSRNNNNYYSPMFSFDDKYTIYFYGINSNLTMYLCARPTFFSRVALDSPVTKTSQNTMKITYEIFTEDFVL